MPLEPTRTWPHSRCFDLDAAPRAAGQARRHTTEALDRWDLTSLADSAELLVSELVTNALKATADMDASTLTLTLRTDRSSLLIEVWDAHPDAPTARQATLDAEGGRGLLLVGSLAKQWSHYFPATGGKVVWCELVV